MTVPKMPTPEQLDEWATWSDMRVMPEVADFLRSPLLREAIETWEAVKWIEAHPGLYIQCDTLVGQEDKPASWALQMWLKANGREHVRSEGDTLPAAVAALREKLEAQDGK